MAVPMQISLDEIITMLLSRVESLALNDENDKTRGNILLRVLYKKGIITEADVEASVREEHDMLKALGIIQELPGDDVVKAITNNLLQWAKGDLDGIKSAMDEYEKKVREYAREEQNRSTLTVASAETLQQLDRLAPPPGSNRGGSKLII